MVRIRDNRVVGSLMESRSWKVSGIDIVVERYLKIMAKKW